jgi:hypothetical protein
MGIILLLLLLPWHLHKPANAQVNVSSLVISTQTKQGTATGFITLINGRIYPGLLSCYF